MILARDMLPALSICSNDLEYVVATRGVRVLLQSWGVTAPQTIWLPGVPT